MQAQATPERGKPLCTHAVQYVTKWYVSHTDSAQAAAVEAENLNWLSGFSLSKEDFQCWQMDDGGKRNGVEGLESTHTHENNGPILKEQKTSVVVHEDVSALTLYSVCRALLTPQHVYSITNYHILYMHVKQNAVIVLSAKV